MNQQEYFESIRKNPKFLTEKTRDVPLEKVLVKDNGGQARKCGTINSHIETLKTDILAKGQQVPITVESISDGEYMVIDGNHRVRALEELYSENDFNAEFGVVKVHERTFSNVNERATYQAKANEHLPARKNTKEDIVHITQAFMDSNMPGVPSILEGGHKNPLFKNDEKEYLKELKGYLKTVYSLSSGELTTIAKQICRGFPNQKFKNYTKTALKNTFDNNNSLGKNWNVYTLGQTSHIFPNVTGNSFKAKTDKPNEKTAVVIWDSNPFGKTDVKLDKYRDTAVEALNKMNNSALLKKGVRLVERVFLAPQKLTSANAEKGFWEVICDKAGNFDANSIPTKGW